MYLCNKKMENNLLNCSYSIIFVNVKGHKKRERPVLYLCRSFSQSCYSERKVYVAPGQTDCMTISLFVHL